MKVKYARFVKTVNVLALKQKMWNSLESKCDIGKEIEEQKTFSGVLDELDGQLKVRYPLSYNRHEKICKQGPQLSNTTVPFCFICLLHLCNEKNLELEKVPGIGIEPRDQGNNLHGIASEIKIIQ